MSGEKIELKKTLGLFNCVSLIVGIIIGSGIFISPKGVIQEVGSIGLSLISWILAGLFSMCGAIAYTELGCMIPKAGGEYEYLMVCFGKIYGFLFIWTFIIIILPASFALTALTFADYSLQPFFSTCDPPFSARILLAACSLLIITFVNCVSVKWTNYLQNVFSISKLVGLLFIIALGIYGLVMGRTENFQNPFENSDWNPGKMALSFYSGLYSYSGWSFLNYVVEEIKNPNKVLPPAILIGLTIVIAIYVCANIAYFTLLSPREMIASSAVAFSFAEKIIGQYSWIISIFVALSTLGYINGTLFAASRTIFGAARNNHMPTLLAFINIKFLTPMTSIIFMALASLVCLIIEDTFVLLKLAMLAEYIFIGGTVVGLLYLRRSQPKLERPIKVNLFFPIVFIILTTLVIGFTFYSTPLDSFVCLGLIFIGVPVYIIFIKIEKPKSIQTKLDNFTLFIQKLTYSAFDESKVQ